MIPDLWTEYTTEQNRAENPLHCTKRQFHEIFVRDFNIVFSPRKIDSCEVCMQYQAKSQTHSHAYKHHRFFHHLGLKLMNDCKQSPLSDTITFCGDLCSVVDCPQLPGGTFYIHQLSCYYFGIVNLSDNSVNIRSWTEIEASRGTSEIATCVYDYIFECCEQNPDIENAVGFFDNCWGQNKSLNNVYRVV